MSEPVCIEPDVCYADEASFGTTKSAAADYIPDRCAVAAGVHVEIENFLPHRNKKTEVALLAGIFLGYLQLDGFVCFLETAEERRNGFPGLEVDGPMFNLDDHIGFELPVEGMKDVICGSGAIIFWVAPIEMMVIDKGAIKKETVVRCQGTSDSVSRVRGGAAVDGWAGLAFGIGLDRESGEVRDFPVDLVCFLFPPTGNPRIERIECFEAADRFGAAEVNRNGKANTPRAKDIGDAAELRKKVIVYDARIGVYVV